MPCPTCGKPLRAKPASDRPPSDKPLGAKSLGDKAQDQAYPPFCSKRCADIDLARWLGGRYAIPGAPADKTADEAEDDRDGGSG